MLAPDCGSGHFCYETMECVENSTQCVPPFSKDCGGEGEENAYCHEGEGCTAGGCSSQDRSTVFTNVDYKVVPGAEWTVSFFPVGELIEKNGLNNIAIIFCRLVVHRSIDG